MSRLTGLRCGRLVVPAADLLRNAPGIAEIPVPVFLIEHAGRVVLVDTGLDPLAAGDPEPEVYRYLRGRVALKYAADESLQHQLALVGRRLGDVSDVILTHAHFEHTGGLGLFPGATLHISAAEWAATRPSGENEVDRFPDLRRAELMRRVETDGDVDLFGDGSVQLLALPGHTPGNLAVLVRLPGRRVVLTGDTVESRASLERDEPGPHDQDRGQSIRSIRQMKRVASLNRADIWVGHDDHDWRRFQQNS